MTKEELNDRYLDWMYQLVCDSRRDKRSSYRKLFSYLYIRPFEFSISLDGNRAADGEDLRYRFGYVEGYSDHQVARYLDDRPCSVLEMMIALAIRCEEHIMEDSEIGDRTGQWFWTMIESLGLEDMTDTRFDIDHVGKVIDRFLNREYSRNGKGGLFTIEGTTRDIRSVEIWYQMFMYLDTIMRKE